MEYIWTTHVSKQTELYLDQKMANMVGRVERGKSSHSQHGEEIVHGSMEAVFISLYHVK